MTKAAIYLRVSTPESDKDSKSGKAKQEPDNQLPGISAYCEAHGLSVVKQYLDRETGTGKRSRPEFSAMMADAKSPARRWEVLVFWSLDRFGRTGTFGTLRDLKELADAGVGFVSVHEQYLDTLGPFKDAIIGLLAAIAQMESERISARVKAGLDRVRKAGVKVGRREVQVDDQALKAMQSQGMSLRRMAQVLGVSRGTVANRLRGEGG
jgi:DNA invertase Pin-like site-specific DNA recombinase